jgi:lactobin A/cerein 7B family class IIb bacteriocin
MNILKDKDMRELEREEMSSVNGGVVFIAVLGAIAVGSYVGGYVYGKLTAEKEPEQPPPPKVDCEPTC